MFQLFSLDRKIMKRQVSIADTKKRGAGASFRRPWRGDGNKVV
jgi:hypothetical protein